MKHIAAICDPGPSHVMATCAIARELQRLGHRVTLFAFPGFEDPAVATGFDVWTPSVPSDYVKRRATWISQARDLRPGDFLQFATERVALVCDHGPDALRQAKVDCVIVDGIDPGAAAVAEHLALPYVTMNNALPLNQEPGVPPDFLPWHYHDAMWARVRHWCAYRLRDLAIRPLHAVLNGYRRAWGLPACRTPDDSFSPFAQLTQLIAEFDFPRRHLPPMFHYVGPYRRAASTDVPFPYERLDGRPLVYASLGTVQGSRAELWNMILDACVGLDVQLVISLGKCHVAGLDGRAAAAGAILVQYAPQVDLLARASLAIQHGGLNSAMEALAAGVPTVTLPVIGDQFGVAARVVHSGTGTAVAANRCTVRTLRRALERTLGDPSYRQRAGVLRQAVAGSRGAREAAEIIAQVASTQQPVHRH